MLCRHGASVKARDHCGLVPLDYALFVCVGGLRPAVRLNWQARTRIAAEVAAALRHLHGLGLSHGRLQPSTILLGEGLAAKLGDSALCGLISSAQVAPTCRWDEQQTLAALLL